MCCCYVVTVDIRFTVLFVITLVYQIRMLYLLFYLLCSRCHFDSQYLAPILHVSEIQRSIRPKSLYSATTLVFNSPDGGVPPGLSPQNFYRKVTDGQGTKRRKNIAENFNRLSRANERY